VCFGSRRLLQALGTRVCPTRPNNYSVWNHRALSARGEIQYYSQCGKTIHVASSYYTLASTVSKHSFPWQYWIYWIYIHIVEARHIGAIASALILILTIDRPGRQCSQSPICQSSWSVSMNPVNNWIQSNATSKVRMGLASWPCRRTRLGRSCSQLILW